MPTARRRRGQTPLDFLVAMGVFLLAVGFVFGFIPTLFEPFGAEAGSTTIADRTAGHFAETALAIPGAPAVLDRDCTARYFNASYTSPPDECRWTVGNGTAAGLREEAGVGRFDDLNVTIESDGQIANVSDPDGAGDIDLAAGAVPPEGTNIAGARRIVSIDGTAYQLRVRVW